MPRYRGKVKLVVLDTAGVLCDGPADLRDQYPEDDLKGVKAPVIPFFEVLKRRRVVVPWEVIRRPMGLFKRDHLRALLQDEAVASQFRRAQGRTWTEEDLEEMFRDFSTLLDEIIVRPELAKPIEGAAAAVAQLRAAGIVVGCDTGYTRSASRALNRVLERDYGLVLDVATNSEEVPAGRPAPWMIFDLMQKANVYPPEAVVKVDDTTKGIWEGRNAGAWTVGVYRTGNDDYETLAGAGPDFLVPSIAEVPGVVLEEIEPRLGRGELPGLRTGDP